MSDRDLSAFVDDTIDAPRRRTLRRLAGFAALPLLPACLPGCGGDTGVARGYRDVSIDASAPGAPIRSLRGVNGPPLPGVQASGHIPSGTTAVKPIFNPRCLDLRDAYRKMGIDFVRTHDVDAFGTGDLDGSAPNRMFPELGADPTDPASYRFQAMDRVMAGVADCGATPFFRLGRSDRSMIAQIGNGGPPADMDRFAEAAAYVVRHYNQGWANGRRDDVRYWEIWNEPDIRPWFWTGDTDQYFQLYAKVARSLQRVDPTLRIGGPSSVVNSNAFGLERDFLDFVRRERLPLDFYSMHWYPVFDDPFDLVRIARKFRTLLDQHGFGATELHLNEWNYALRSHTTEARHAAFVAVSLMLLQDAPVDRAAMYARTMPLIHDDGELTAAGQVFVALAGFDGMHRLSMSGGDDEGFAVLGGLSPDARRARVLIANYEIDADHLGPLPNGNDIEVLPDVVLTVPDRRTITYRNNAGYRLSLDGLRWPRGARVSRHRIDEQRRLERVETIDVAPGQRLERAMPPSTVELLLAEAL
ncbi:GH39 family glycosyl hydrolase [Chitinasiproducens palmae]|uniref:Glycosyl hydrolases family 39 n=1 Tax=Chitinasiproducens palmae TaxID=1770053 RepID=A0A1H2PTI5_9BURK|nr:hypothetical protein [Chitinasiproducens palmae]SDV50424.1 Glycosyl hydrolases family 39 [Chitinasiproducens palmae]